MHFIEPQDILNATNGGLDIIVYLYPEAEKSVAKPSRKFKLRGDEKTASASLSRAKDGNWLVKDFGSGDKARNGIGCYAFERNIPWPQALQELAEKFNINGKEKIETSVKAGYEERSATTEEKDGDWTYELRDSFTDFEIETIFSRNVLKYINWRNPEKKKEAYAKIKTVCNRYNFYPVLSYTLIKDRKAKTFTSNENYPIFLIDEGKFKKIYQPLNANKGFRFMYVGGSEKPDDFIHGLAQAKAEYKKREDAALSDDDDYEDLDEDEKKKTRKVEKLEEIIICSGGSDALNLALLGYWVTWLNSETATLTPWHWADMSKIAKKVCQLQDIDDTGKRSAHKNALQYLDLFTIVLPEDLKKKRDTRLNPCKDVRDYFNHWTYYDFRDLLKVALPYRFWEQVPEYAGRGENRTFVGYKYEFDNVQAYNFLSKNGFYRLPFEGKKTEYIFVQVDGNIVREVRPNRVKNYMHNFLKERMYEKELRNTLYRSTQLNESSLSNLDETEIEFCDHTEKSQFLFFSNCTWEVTAEGVKQYKSGVIQRYVWEKDVIEHHANVVDEPAFTITKNKDDDSWDIEIHHHNCLFLNYLINASRIHWKKELEEELDKLPEEEREQYRLKHKFSIAGPLLTEEEQQDQKLHLINKLFAIGYLLHQHKDDNKAWAVIGMDNKINDDGGSHGGSGKSIMLQKAMQKILKRTFVIPGTNPKKTDDPHIYDGLTEHHQYVYMDDMDKYMKFRFFYDLITSDVTVNPKNNQPYTIPFTKSPKFALTTNFTLRNDGPSTHRRVLYTVFSDWYHNAGEHNEYKESRSPNTDMGKNLFTEFTADEWNQFYNTMARALQFFLSTSEKIEPPMDNVTKRNLQSIMGLNFENWAAVYFSEESGNTDRLIVKDEAFKDFSYSNKLGWSPQQFTAAVKAFCQFYGYIYNPEELRNADKGKRIIKRVEERKQNSSGTWEKTGVMKAKEMLYIQTDFENPLNGSHPDEEGDKLPF